MKIYQSNSKIRLSIAFFFFALFALLPITSNADVLELKDGTSLDGTYKGSAQGGIRFEVNGELQVVPMADIITLTISGTSSSSSQTSPTATPSPTKP